MALITCIMFVYSQYTCLIFTSGNPEVPEIDPSDLTRDSISMAVEIFGLWNSGEQHLPKAQSRKQFWMKSVEMYSQKCQNENINNNI